MIMSRFNKADKLIDLRSVIRRVFNSVRSRRSSTGCMTGGASSNSCLLSTQLRVSGIGSLFSLSLPRDSRCVALNKLVLRRCRDFPGLGRMVGFSGFRFGVVGSASHGVRLIGLRVVG